MTEHVEVRRHIGAPIDRVWARYVDHARWSEWAGTPGSKLVVRGTPDENGVGSVRQFAGYVREAVTEFETPARLAYRVTRGMPFRGHEGEVTFAVTDDGTDVVWRCHFDPIIPGTGAALRRLVTGTFTRALAGLAKDLEPRPPSGA